MADDLALPSCPWSRLSPRPDSPEALTEEDLPKLFDQYELLANDMLRRQKAGKPITFYHYILDLKHGPCIYKRISGCGSGTEYMAVTPWGRPVPLPPVCRRPGVQAGQRLGRRDQHRPARRVQAVQRLCPPRLQGLLGTPVLRGRLRRQRPARYRRHPWHYEYGCKVFRKRMSAP